MKTETKTQYRCIVSLELELYVDADTKVDVVDYAENIELPDRYKENSFNIKSIEKMV